MEPSRLDEFDIMDKWNDEFLQENEQMILQGIFVNDQDMS